MLNNSKNWLMVLFCNSACCCRWAARPAWCSSTTSSWPTSSGCWWRVSTCTHCCSSSTPTTSASPSTCSLAGVGHTTAGALLVCCDNIQPRGLWPCTGTALLAHSKRSKKLSVERRMLHTLAKRHNSDRADDISVGLCGIKCCLCCLYRLFAVDHPQKKAAEEKK